MMSKYKQYTNYKDCDLIWINKIPEHWEILSFRNILVERNEKNSPIKSKERLSLSINKGVTLYADKTTNLDRFKDDFTNYKLAHEGDLVLNSMNMIVGAVGVSNYFGCVSPIYYTFASDPNKCNSTKYYEYLFRSKIVQGVLFSLGRGLIAKDRGDGKYNTLRLKVSRSDLRSLKLPNPNYSEQTQIVSFLSYKLTKIDRFIRKKKQLIKLLNEKKTAIINQAVTKGLNPNAKMKLSGIEWLGDIPEHWEVKPLKYFVTCNDEALNEKTDKEYLIRYIDISNVDKNGKVSEIVNYKFKDAPSRARRIVKNGDIIVSTVRTYLKAITQIIGDSNNLIVSTGFAVLRPRENILSNFLNYAIRANYFIGRIMSESKGVSYPAINSTELVALKIAIPSIDEQESIVQSIDSETAIINNTISIIDKEIALVEEYKTSLIAEAVTGKIDVRNFEILETLEVEPYEELEEELSMVAEDEAEYETKDIE